MANEDMIKSSVGGRSAGNNKGTYGEEEAWPMAEELKSAAPAVAKIMLKKPAWYSTKPKSVRALSERKVRGLCAQKSDETVLTALGVGFVLGLIYKH